MRKRREQRLRALIVYESAERAAVLHAALERAGCEVSSSLSSPLRLIEEVADTEPDLIIIDIESPVSDVLEHLITITRDLPRPIVMFSGDDAASTIRHAVRAGVSASVVNGLDPSRVKSIMDVALARFDECHRLRLLLAEATQKLADRGLIKRARGILMKSRTMSEDEAYQVLRSMAMARGKRIGEIAGQVIDMAGLLGLFPGEDSARRRKSAP